MGRGRWTAALEGLRACLGLPPVRFWGRGSELVVRGWAAKSVGEVAEEGEIAEMVENEGGRKSMKK